MTEAEAAADATLIGTLADMLEEHEWIYDDNPPRVSCWRCGASAPPSGSRFQQRSHKPGCVLAAALAEAEQRRTRP